MRYVVFSLLLTIIYSSLHYFLIGYNNLYLLPVNIIISFSYLISICSLWHIGEQFKKTRIINIVAAVLFFAPLSELFYFKLYKGLMSTELMAMMVREVGFLWELTLTGFSLQNMGFAILGISIIYFIVRVIFKISEDKINHFFLFKKWPVVATLLLVIIYQIYWCINHDLSRLPERVLTPPLIVFILSAIIIQLNTINEPWKKALIIFTPLINLTLSYLLSTSFMAGILKDSTFDTRFYHSAFTSILNSKARTPLSQSAVGAGKVAMQPEAKLDYNVLVVVLDALRMDALTIGGNKRNTDQNLKWFYENTTIFDYAISPANMTDTSIPTMFSGLGTESSIKEIKDSLRLWDYYSNGAKTFYYLTADMAFADIDKFLITDGLDKIWSADSGQNSKLDVITNGDFLSKESLSAHLWKLKKQNYVGVWHADATHSYIKYAAPKEFLIFKQDPKKGELFNRRVNYDNAAHYSTTMTSELLKVVDLKNTIVIFTSDHGEAFNEHGYNFHNQNYHQEAVRVPFIWHIPSRLKNKLSKKSKECFSENSKSVVSTLDLIPTLLELHKQVTGVNLNQTNETFTGKNLFKCLPKDRIVVSSHCLNGFRCFKKNILFASNEYSLLYDADKGIEGIYETFKDIDQLKELDFESIKMNPGIQNIISNAPNLHPLGNNLYINEQ